MKAYILIAMLAAIAILGVSSATASHSTYWYDDYHSGYGNAHYGDHFDRDSYDIRSAICRTSNCQPYRRYTGGPVIVTNDNYYRSGGKFHRGVHRGYGGFYDPVSDRYEYSSYGYGGYHGYGSRHYDPVLYRGWGDPGYNRYY